MLFHCRCSFLLYFQFKKNLITFFHSGVYFLKANKVCISLNRSCIVSTFNSKSTFCSLSNSTCFWISGILQQLLNLHHCLVLLYRKWYYFSTLLQFFYFRDKAFDVWTLMYPFFEENWSRLLDDLIVVPNQFHKWREIHDGNSKKWNMNCHRCPFGRRPSYDVSNKPPIKFLRWVISTWFSSDISSAFKIASMVEQVFFCALRNFHSSHQGPDLLELAWRKKSRCIERVRTHSYGHGQYGIQHERAHGERGGLSENK